MRTAALIALFFLDATTVAAQTPATAASSATLATTTGDASSEAGAEPAGSRFVNRLAQSLVEPPSRPRAQGLVTEAVPEAAVTPPDEPVLELGGALRFNLFAKTWPQAETITSGGDNVAFDTFRLNVDSYYRGLHLSAEYRFYAGYNMLHHGYLAYTTPEVVDVALGVMRAPFGLQPYASHNWFFGLTYYLGFEDDYDLGLRGDLHFGPVDVQLAYFRNDEGSYSGGSVDSARYSYDVVRASSAEIASLDGDRRNEPRARQLRLLRSAAAGAALRLRPGKPGGARPPLCRDGGVRRPL